MKIQFNHSFNEIISLDNLLLAWQEFLRGKRKRRDVQGFSFRLMNNIIALHNDLKNKTYHHGGYEHFKVSDPKPRDIHKASVRDRLLHHAIYRQLYPFFERTFITDSFSCRLNKGTHKAINRFRQRAYRPSKNHTTTCWALKCDIRKFFENIDHSVLLKMLDEYILDQNIFNLLAEIIQSFEAKPGKGLPLGNLTSQLLVNIYMNKFDQFVKHKVKAKYYLRYADDFIIMSNNRSLLDKNLQLVDTFLRNELKLELHPQKVSIETIASGVDFLGWVNFSHHTILRAKTKKRMLKRLKKNPTPESITSYLGFLKHGNTFSLQQKIVNDYWFWEE